MLGEKENYLFCAVARNHLDRVSSGQLKIRGWSSRNISARDTNFEVIGLLLVIKTKGEDEDLY